MSNGLDKKAKKDNNEKQEKGARSKSRKRGKSKGKQDHAAEVADDSFKIAKNINFTLELDRVKTNDLMQLHYYPEYQWLMDFGFCALLVYIFTEMYYYFLPNQNEFNLSLVWCALVAAFTLKALTSLTALYFRGGDEAMGERSVCLTSTCIFFLISMMVLITSENFLEFGLDEAYSTFNSTAHSYLQAHGLSYPASGPASMLMFKLSLAVWSGFIGGLYTFPGLRFAQMHRDALRYAEGRRVMQ